MFLVIVCACIVAAGFFFAARQHFTSMEYGLKNSTLRQQLQDLETEKRRLILAREVAVSPMSIRKAAHEIGMRKSTEMVAVQASAKQEVDKGIVVQPARVVMAKGSADRTVVPTVMTAPTTSRQSGETRSRIADTGKDKKDKTEVAALLKLR
jgi:hypothetical protein